MLTSTCGWIWYPKPWKAISRHRLMRFFCKTIRDQDAICLRKSPSARHSTLCEAIRGYQ